MSGTTTGAYDAMFEETGFNCLNAVPYIGNVAVTYAHAANYNSSVTDEYYWRAYQCLGDGSVMPYLKVPAANNVSHASTIGIGMTSFVVNADAGSYVAITKNNEILGVAEVPSNGSVEVPVAGLNSAGDVMIVVTRQQRQPYIQTIQAVSLDGPYVTADSYTPNTAHVGDDTNLSITFKNVGTAATSGTTTVTLTPGDNNSTIVVNSKTFSSLAANATTTVSGFKFNINPGVADGTVVKLHYAATNGSNTWEGDLDVTAGEAILEYQNMTWDGGFTPGETLTLTAKFKNTGHYQATNAVATISTTSSNYLTINTESVNVGTIAVDQEVTCQFNVTVNANCPETAQIPVTFNLTANGNLSAQGTATLKNACNVVFDLRDSYGDGWNGASLTVAFSDGTASQNMTVASGSSSATYTLEIGNGTHVTVTFASGSYDSECSFSIKYEEGDLTIYQSSGTPSAGEVCQFDCNCGAASQTYTVNVSSSNTAQGTVSGGGEFSFGQSCTVTATPADGYMFTGWTMNGEIVSTASTYTILVDSDMDLVANFAEGNMIGDGGEATNNYLPTYNYYNYSLTEQIYTSAELGNEGLITSIAFYNGGTEKTRTLDLYMKNTTKSSFSGNSDWIAVSASDKVFSGSVTFTADDWTVVTFSTPFVYDGTSNVVLVTDDNTSGYTNSPHMACRVFDAASQAIYVYSDGTNYSPSSPSSYTGTVLSVKNQLLITKEAVSTEPVYITVSVSPAQAGTVSGGGEYVFGDVCTVSVTPNEGYFFTGWTENGAVVSSDLEYSFSATSDRDLVATFVQGIEIGEFTTTNNSYIPSYNYYNYSLTQQIYTAEEIGSAGTINWIAFYNEGAEKTRTYDFYLKATEKTSFSSNADWVTVSASDKVFSGSVTMAVGTWTIINFTTPFEYNGTSNLVLVVDDNTGEYTSSPHMTCSVFNTAENQAIYIYNDNTNFDPMSPPAASTNNDVLSVKNHILLGISNVMTIPKYIIGVGEDNWNSESNGGYYLIASPMMESITPSEDNGFITEAFDLYYFNEGVNDFEWRNYGTETFDIVSGKGYLYASKTDTQLQFTGVPYSGNGEVTLHKTDGANFEGWNLVGNPFNELAYIADGRDFYTMQNDGSEILLSNSNSIEAMEAVFVIAENDGEIMTFTTNEPAKHYKGLALNLSRNNSLIDRAVVRFGEGRQLPKFQLRENSTKVYIMMDGEDYAVVNAEAQGEIPVSFKASENGTYTLSFNSENVMFDYLHLIDNMTGADVDLLAAGPSTGSGASYTFTAKTTDYTSRFKLVFATGTSTSSDTFAFYSNGQIIVPGMNGNSTLQVVDVTGRVIVSRRGDVSGNVSTANMPAGVYVLRLINGNDVKTQKMVIQ
ncbi:MAG: T9SS type A sorting domain-containing protein [Bacteroidales bacterium]|nr:T9SS type A sorting domain-containing protein [Bacteroidales bacterium]